MLDVIAAMTDISAELKAPVLGWLLSSEEQNTPFLSSTVFLICDGIHILTRHINYAKRKFWN